MASDARSNWGSKIGFILSATGSAVGIGAIWKFPYMSGANGGAAFILPFVLMVFCFGVLLILAEMVIGRHGRGSVVTSFRRIAGPAWVPLGFIAVFNSFLIMCYYSTVGGWCITYLVESIIGSAVSADLQSLETTFMATISSPTSSIIYQSLFLIITASVLLFEINRGIEKVSKILMPCLFILMCVLIVRGLSLPNAWKGVEFLFLPHWELFTAQSLLNALGFTFFSLSVGMGIMITYGSYVKHTEDLTGSAMWVAFLAFSSCILAGLMVIPPVLAFGLNPSAGPGLTFITMPAVFSHMPLGEVCAVAFYICLFVAALTSMISLFEVVLTYLIDEWKLPRKPAAIGLLLALLVCSVPSSLSMGPWGDIKFFGKNIFDLLDFIACNILMPLGALFVIAIAGWFFWEKTVYELCITRKHSALWLKTLRFMLSVVAPCLIIIISVSNLI